MEARTIPRPPLARANFIGDPVKVAAWRAHGAPQDLIDDLSFGIWVPTNPPSKLLLLSWTFWSMNTKSLKSLNLPSPPPSLVLWALCRKKMISCPMYPRTRGFGSATRRAATNSIGLNLLAGVITGLPTLTISVSFPTLLVTFFGRKVSTPGPSLTTLSVSTPPSKVPEEAPNKLCPPAQEMEVLGYLVNTVSMLISIPDKKRTELVELCALFSKRSSATLREIQSFVGKLVWAARVVKGGKVFLSRMFPLLFAEGSKSCLIRLTKKFQADVSWWCRFLTRWNGISLIPRSTSFTVYTDALKFGFRAVCDDLWISGAWRPDQLAKHSNWKELCTILIAVRQWGHLWQGCQVNLFSDNIASVAICN